MRYYTGIYETEEVAPLYKEWTGKDMNYDLLPLLNTFFIGAREENNLIGLVHLVIVNDPFWNLIWGRIDTIYVKEGYRRQGIGRELIKVTIQQATLFGCSFIRLDTEYGNDIAQAFYKSLGFTKDYSYCWKIK